MEAWRETWSGFRERLGKLRTAEESFTLKRQQIQFAKQRLASVLGQSEEKEFSLLFNAAKKLVQDGEQAAGRRIEMKNQLGLLKSELDKLVKQRVRLATATATSTEQWNFQCAAVGLPTGSSPEAGLTLLGERKELLAKFDDWQECFNKSKAAEKAIHQYEQSVREKAGALGSKGDTTEAQESALWKALTEARKAQDRRDQLAGQIEAVGGELAEAQERFKRSEQTLHELIALSGLSSVSELEPLLAHLEQRNRLQEQIAVLRNTLSGLARGQAVDEFVARVRAENPDVLGERKPVAAQEKAHKESALRTIRDTLFQLEAQKKELEKAGDAAADFRQQAESCAATLRQDAARFLRLRLATQLLENQIERFRKENQGPLLAEIRCGIQSHHSWRVH